MPIHVYSDGRPYPLATGRFISQPSIVDSLASRLAGKRPNRC
ncbi:hypothetical protein Q31a_59570 [Aureliella helgolandensis]|uniref:Uncharacterized protein n=1 Tax=Aureliella helgolandensis TaxID=2527968 RepID=A0A518GG87_9BACT|nr:hypothetical protein Q31a_59570 [Aureliella helgolandensis]